MAGGILGELTDILFGEGPSFQASGVFPGAPRVGQKFMQLLLERMKFPTEQRIFPVLEEALRESVGRVAGTQRQRLGEAAVAGGFFESGERLQGLETISRQEVQAFTQGMRDILLGLEGRRTEGVLPFLGGASQEALALQQLQLGKRGQDIGFITGAAELGLTAGGVGGFGGGSSTDDLLAILGED